MAAERSRPPTSFTTYRTVATVHVEDSKGTDEGAEEEEYVNVRISRQNMCAEDLREAAAFLLRHADYLGPKKPRTVVGEPAAPPRRRLEV